MLTKLMAAFVMAGALCVAGDSLYRELACSGQPSRCCLTRARQTSNCCSTESNCCEVSRSSCCTKTSTPSTEFCCEAAFTYCTRTQQVYVGCCCEIVDGRYRCLATGEILDECCCIPLPD